MRVDQGDGLSERDLRAAFADGRFELHYQPQHASRDNALVGVEALVRLRMPDGSLVSPDCFIAQVEQTGLVHELGLSLFELGCMQAARWPSLTVAINVSPIQFKDAALPARLARIAARAAVDPSRMEIEITEGLFFEDPDRAEVALHALHDAGFGIALDDFGTGFSSLGYLLRFPVNKIKIDRSFVRGLPDDMKSASIIHALVALGRALGLKIVAEGVETEGQRQFLRVAGCHLLQGYLFSGAVSQEDITAQLRAGAVASIGCPPNGVGRPDPMLAPLKSQRAGG